MLEYVYIDESVRGRTLSGIATPRVQLAFTLYLRVHFFLQQNLSILHVNLPVSILKHVIPSLSVVRCEKHVLIISCREIAQYLSTAATFESIVRIGPDDSSHFHSPFNTSRPSDQELQSPSPLISALIDHVYSCKPSITVK